MARTQRGARGPRRAAPQRAAAAAGGQPAAQVMVVNMIPEALSFETDNDSEPNLAVNPANPQQIAASAFTMSASGAAPIYVSSDGGQSWMLNAIVPSDRMTADITLRFADSSNMLYAGIIPQPLETDPRGNTVTRLNILSTDNFIGPTKMKVLVDRTGVDQPYVQAASIGDATAGRRDLVMVGSNDFNDPQGRTAVIDVSPDAAGATPAFQTVRVDPRVPPPGGADAPSIRPAIHRDGTVYGAFLALIGGTNLSNLRRDIVVVRDDNFATGAAPFTALVDPDDGRAGRRVARNRLVPFLPMADEPGPIGQERIGSHVSIAVDPRDGQSATVYLAWADRVGTTDYTIHVQRSTDRGVTWSPNDLLTITNAVNPALAINASGMIGFLYQQLVGPFTPGIVTAANRWVTHFRRSADGTNWDDIVLATVPAAQPPARGLPYLGDYVHMLAVGSDFYGVFSTANTPDPANFPAGVVFQRKHDMNAKTLLDMDGVTPVAISIDPFFFKVLG